MEDTTLLANFTLRGSWRKTIPFTFATRHMVEGPTAILKSAERFSDHNYSGVLRNFDLSLARAANLRAGGGESVESLHYEKQVGVGSGLSIRYLAGAF